MHIHVYGCESLHKLICKLLQVCSKARTEGILKGHYEFTKLICKLLQVYSIAWTGQGISKGHYEFTKLITTSVQQSLDRGNIKGTLRVCKINLQITTSVQQSLGRGNIKGTLRVCKIIPL